MTDFYWDCDPKIRTKHLYIPGMSGYGKTSLMANLAIEDIERADGPVIVIDPKGSKEGLVERVIKNIPEERVPNVFYISLRHPHPIDILDFRDQHEKNLVRSDIVTILKRFSYGSWGPNMQAVLNNLVPTLLEANDATFLDLGYFLESKKRRDQILEQVSEKRRDYWNENPPSKTDIGPISNRMSNFYEPPLSTIVSARRGEGTSIAEIIERNQILLLDTSPLSEDGLMLGAIVMSRIQQAVFRRSAEKEYPICHVYADEFQNFQTSAFNVMLSQARSFNLSLCVANQHPKQITDIWDDIIGCISSYAIFRMAGEHAFMLKSKIQDVVDNTDETERADLEDRLSAQEEREKYWGNRSQEDHGEDEHADAVGEWQEANNEVLRIRDILNEPPPPSPKPYLDQIPSLAVGEAIYVDHSGETARIKIRRPPVPLAVNYAQQIMNATYAQSIQNRTVEKYSCDTKADVVSLGHGLRSDTQKEKPDAEPSGPPNLPPYRRKEKRP